MIKSVFVLAVDTGGGILMLAPKNGADKGRFGGLGGEVDMGETPRLAAVRIMHEQCGLEVEPHMLQFVGTRYKRTEDVELHAFALERVDAEKIKERDGQKIISIKLATAARDAKILPWIKDLINDYVKKFASLSR